jgi:hypothetical protein
LDSIGWVRSNAFSFCPIFKAVGWII